MFGLFILTPLGLNNIPICTVNDDENSLDTLWGVGQFNHLEKDEVPFAKCSQPPTTAPPESTVRGVSPASNSVKVPPPRPHSGESLRPTTNYQGRGLGDGGGSIQLLIQLWFFKNSHEIFSL